MAKAPRVIQMDAGFCLQVNAGGSGSWGLLPVAQGSVPAVAAGLGSNSFQLQTSLQNLYVGIGGSSPALTVAWPNYVDATTAYERYRIVKMQIRMVYQNNSTTVGSLGSLPVFYMANDYTDTGSLTLTQIQQYCPKVVNFGDSKSKLYTLFPRFQKVVTYGTAGATAYSATSSEKGEWVSTDVPTALHLGVKGVYDNPYATAAVDYGVVTFYVTQWVELIDQK